MKFFKEMLLLPMALVYLSACGGTVEGGGTDNTPTSFNFLNGDPTGSVNKVCSITAEFDDQILPQSVTDQSFIVQSVTATDPLSSADGTWGLSPSSNTIALFTPSINLIGSYSVTITTAITNSSGVSLAQNQFWTFTAALPCTP